MDCKIFNFVVVFSLFAYTSEMIGDCDSSTNLLPTLASGGVVNPAYDPTGSIIYSGDNHVAISSSGSSLQISPAIKPGSYYNTGFEASSLDPLSSVTVGQGTYSERFALTSTSRPYNASFKAGSGPISWYFTVGTASVQFGSPCLSFDYTPTPMNQFFTPRYSPSTRMAAFVFYVLLNAGPTRVPSGFEDYPIVWRPGTENDLGDRFRPQFKSELAWNPLEAQKYVLGSSFMASFAETIMNQDRKWPSANAECQASNSPPKELNPNDLLITGEMPLDVLKESIESYNEVFSERSLLAQTALPDVNFEINGFSGKFETKGPSTEIMAVRPSPIGGFSIADSFSKGPEISMLRDSIPPEAYLSNNNKKLASAGIFLRDASSGRNSDTADLTSLKAMGFDETQMNQRLPSHQTNLLSEASLNGALDAGNEFREFQYSKDLESGPKRTIHSNNVIDRLYAFWKGLSKGEEQNSRAGELAWYYSSLAKRFSEGSGCFVGSSNQEILGAEDLIAFNSEKNSDLITLGSFENFKIKESDTESFLHSCIPLKYELLMISRNYGMAALNFKKTAEIFRDMKEKVSLMIEEIELENRKHPFRVSQNENLNEDQLVAAKDLAGSSASTSESSANNEKTTVHVWTRAVGQYINLSKSHKTPASEVGSGGAMVGADWKLHDFTLGFSGGYIYSYAGIEHKEGHTNLNQGVLSVYSGWKSENWALNYSLISGYAASNNHRYFLSENIPQKAVANSHLWQFGPHFDISYKGIIKGSWFETEPFASGDWLGSWSSKYKEKGSSSAISQDGFFSSFLRIESGFRFRERIAIRYGYLGLSESISYGYQRMFNPTTSILSIIGSPESFSVANSSSIQSLGIVGFGMKFEPRNKSLPIVELEYQGQYGSVYQAQVGSINISKDF